MKLPSFCLPCLIAVAVALPHAALVQAESASAELLEKCPMPTLPSIPNGMNSTEAEMLAAQQEIKAYIAAAEATLGCLDTLRQEWGEAAGAERIEINNLFYDKLVEQMRTTGELFNSAVRAFKGRQQ